MNFQQLLEQEHRKLERNYQLEKGVMEQNEESLILFHGTSSKYLKSIQEKGLIPDSTSGWTGDRKGSERDLTSFYGVYLTTSFKKAYNVGEVQSLRSPYNIIIVEANVDKENVLLDEDEVDSLITRWIYDALDLRRFSRIVSADYIGLDGLLRLYIPLKKDDHPQHQSLVNSILSNVPEQIKPLENNRLLDIVESFIERPLSHWVQKEYNSLDLEKIIKDLNVNSAKVENVIENVPSITEAEKNYRNHLDKLSRSINDIEKGSFRVEDQINFTGNNRIVSIVEINEDAQTYVKHYGQPSFEYTLIDWGFSLAK